MGHTLTTVLKQSYRKYGAELFAVIFSGWGLYLRFLGLANRELWGDETYALPWWSGPLKPFWQRLSYGAELTAFPGHYVITWPFVKVFGLNKWGIMIPQILATCFSFYLLYLACKRYYKNPLSFAIVFALACFNPELIFHSFEFRPYSVLIALSVAIFYFSDLVISEPDRLGRKKLWVGALFVFAVFYHAYGLPIICLTAAFFVLKESARRPFRDIAGKAWRFYAAVSLLAVPIFLWYSLGSLAVAHKLNIGIDTFQFIPNPLVNLSGFLKGVFCNLTGDKRLYFLCIGIILSFLTPHKDRPAQLGFLLILVIIPIQLLLLADLRQNYWFIQRHFIWITPLFLFFIGWCWDSLIEWRKGV